MGIKKVRCEMRMCAWYSPKLDVIVIQTLTDSCNLNFELSWEDCFDILLELKDPMQVYLWIFLGEL